MKTIFLRKHFFESNKKFGGRVNSILAYIEQYFLLQNITYSNNVVMILYREQEKKPTTVKGFSK